VNPSITLGRVAGIRIGINWSWLVVFALIVWSLASSVFPGQNPHLADGTYVGMALVAALFFFASLLLHELGHALQARREGMEIDGITLWLFGGCRPLPRHVSLGRRRAADRARRAVCIARARRALRRPRPRL
jgi:Zn-dependent protease